jgi:uncharacterized membrane protein
MMESASKYLSIRPNTNISEAERLSALIGGGALAAWGLAQRSWPGVCWAALGGSLAWMGARGYSPVHQVLGFNTAGRGGRHTAVPYELGIRVDRSVVIRRSPAEVYAFWRNLENLPRIMRHLVRVEVKDDLRSHWVARGPMDGTVAWDAEIINDVPGRLIGWRSLAGSDVDSGGSVEFRGLGGRGDRTEVRVAMQYNPPAGALGAAVAQMMGKDPSRQVRDDLDRFRRLMESGREKEPDRLAAPAPSSKVWEREKDAVQQSSEESFPASDAPSWTPESLPTK